MRGRKAAQWRAEAVAEELSSVLPTTAESLSSCSCCGSKEDSAKLLLCSACFSTAYCSPACQKANWPQHKQECKKKALLSRVNLSPVMCSSNPPLNILQKAIALSWTLRDDGAYFEALYMMCGTVNFEKVDAAARGRVLEWMLRGIRKFPWGAEIGRDGLLARMVCLREMGVSLDATEEAVRIADQHFAAINDRPTDRDLVAYALLIWTELKAMTATEMQEGEGKEETTRVVEELGEKALAGLDGHSVPLHGKIDWGRLLSKVALERLGPLHLYRLEARYLEKAIQLGNRSGRGYMIKDMLPIFLADTLLWMRRFSEAEQVLLKVKKHKKDHFRGALADLRLAVIAFERGDTEETGRTARRALNHLSEVNSIGRFIAALLVANSEDDPADGDLAASSLMDEFPPVDSDDATCISLAFGEEQQVPDHAFDEPGKRLRMYEQHLRDAVQRTSGEDGSSPWSWHYHNVRHHARMKLVAFLRERGGEEALQEAQALEQEAADAEQSTLRLLEEMRGMGRSERRTRKKRQGAASPPPSSSGATACAAEGDDQEPGVDKGTNETVEEPDGDECYVCYDELVERTTATLACGHVYHEECVDEWVSRCRTHKLPPTCPVCKADLLV